MKRIIVAISMLFLFSFPLGAQETEHSKLATQLAKELGLESMLLNAQIQARQSADKQFSQMMNHFKKSFTNMPDQYMKEFEVAGAEFVNKVSSGWDTEEAAYIYTSSLADTLPEKQLRESLEHYRTPQGQIELKAINEASKKLSIYILSNSQKASEAATQEFIYKLKRIAEKAKQDREARSN